MIQRRAFWCALTLAASGCGVDLSLGELDPEPTPPLVDGENPTGAEPVYEDGVAPERIANPEVTFTLGSAQPSLTGNLSAGDLDGDGFDDMAMIVKDNGTGTEFIHLRYGSPRPTNEIEALEFSESGARLIVRVATENAVGVIGVHPVGDFDGDGYADMFVQTFADHLTENNGGYLLYGGPERLSGIHELRAVASHLDPGGRLSKTPFANYSLAAPGDIDGDGFDDLAMTNPESTPVEPGIYVFYGRSQRLPAEVPWSEAAVRLAYPLFEPRLIDTGLDLDGDGVAETSYLNPTQPVLGSGGDIDGDGLADLLVSYMDLNGGDAGVDRRIIVVRGAATRPTGTMNLLDIQPQMKFPEAEPIISLLVPTIRGVGDLDADGRSDFILGSEPGDSYVFYGSPELLSGPIQLSQANATFPGVSLAPVGDRDGDGDDELMALRPLEYQNLPGLSELQWASAMATVSGSRDRLSGEITLLPDPSFEDAHVYPESWQRLAYLVLSAGDLDNDGATELITLSRSTVPSADPALLEPQLHIHYGVHVPAVTPDGPH